MGCSLSNNLVLPDPAAANRPRQQQQRGNLFISSNKTATETDADGRSFKSAVYLNDIIIDKSMRHTFAEYLKEEKEAVEVTNNVDIAKELEDEEMNRLMHELVLCFQNFKDTDLTETTTSPVSMKSSSLSPQPTKPAKQESTDPNRAKNELIMLLAANNLQSFSQSNTFREHTITRRVSQWDSPRKNEEKKL